MTDALPIEPPKPNEERIERFIEMEAMGSGLASYLRTLTRVAYKQGWSDCVEAIHKSCPKGEPKQDV
jgi:hypothetical protein